VVDTVCPVTTFAIDIVVSVLAHLAFVVIRRFELCTSTAVCVTRLADVLGRQVSAVTVVTLTPELLLMRVVTTFTVVTSIVPIALLTLSIAA
jgi:hypothetical protein